MQVGKTETYKLQQIYIICYTYFPCYKIYHCHLCLGSTYIIFYANSTYFEICIVFLCQLYIRYKDQALYTYLSLWVLQDVEIDEEVDVIISEWMGYMLLYEVHIRIRLIFLSRYTFWEVKTSYHVIGEWDHILTSEGTASLITWMDWNWAKVSFIIIRKMDVERLTILLHT